MDQSALSPVQTLEYSPLQHSLITVLVPKCFQQVKGPECHRVLFASWWYANQWSLMLLVLVLEYTAVLQSAVPSQTELSPPFLLEHCQHPEPESLLSSYSWTGGLMVSGRAKDGCLLRMYEYSLLLTLHPHLCSCRFLQRGKEDPKYSM